MLYEAGFGAPHSPDTPGAVCVTQPRRVAVTSTAQRVAFELGVRLGGREVGYAVRHDARDAAGVCALRFVTDGVLLREAAADLLLSRYSCVVVDEAHERGVNTDILLGLLSRIVRLRAAPPPAVPPFAPLGPLKLVIMSATLRTADFVANARLFPSPPPLITVPARQFPVTLHFSRRTPPPDKRLQAAFSKVCAIHRRLPPGGVLVFLTGQREVLALVARLRAAFASSAPHPPESGSNVEAAADEGDAEATRERDSDSDADLPPEIENEDDDTSGDEEETQQLGGSELSAEELAAAAARDADEFAAAAAAARAAAQVGPAHILPLFAMLPPAAQARVFSPPPAGSRLIVVATDVERNYASQRTY
jgi:ATP-dependent RNA helicase DHX37/DHR1